MQFFEVFYNWTEQDMNHSDILQDIKNKYLIKCIEN